MVPPLSSDVKANRTLETLKGGYRNTRKLSQNFGEHPFSTNLVSCLGEGGASGGAPQCGDQRCLSFVAGHKDLAFRVSLDPDGATTVQLIA